MAIGPQKPTIRWRGRQATAEIQNATFRGLKKAASWVEGTIKKRVISRSSRVSGGGGARSPRRGARKPMRLMHSKPGEPPRTDTGKLRQSIFSSSDRRQMLAVVGTALKYGVYLELGTRPGPPIVPRRKKMLAFGGIDASGQWGWVFARRVRHPGMRPRPYMWKTVRGNRRKIMAIIRAQSTRALRGRVHLGR